MDSNTGTARADVESEVRRKDVDLSNQPSARASARIIERPADAVSPDDRRIR